MCSSERVLRYIQSQSTSKKERCEKSYSRSGEFVSQIEFDGSRVSHDLYKFEFVIQDLVSQLDTSECLGVVRKGHDEEADFLWLCALFRVTCCDDVPSCLVGRSLDKKDGSHLS
jgi:hypothetical protein